MKSRKEAVHWLNNGLKVAGKRERVSPLGWDELWFWTRGDGGNFDVSAWMYGTTWSDESDY
jgi:hypothetical protein